MTGGNNVIVNELFMEIYWEDLYKIVGNDRVLAIKNANEKFEVMCFFYGSEGFRFWTIEERVGM